ncbi:MAG: acyltransferase [Hyphomonadaceae bacterium]|nr:acyltransferase [Hyphomonadaceae bacterium]
MSPQPDPRADRGVAARQHGAKPPSAVDNNFNALRLMFALMVAVYHAILLPGVPGWKVLEGPTSVMAEVGVQGFFMLSGYLVYASLERSSSLRLYAEKRVRRLYPAYATVVIVCAVAAVVLVPEARANLAGVGGYLGWNLVFLNFMAPDLPGVFQANRFHEVNGALWTLKIEVMFYIILPLLIWLLRAVGRMRWGLIILIYVGAEAWRWGFETMDGNVSLGAEIARQLPGQMSFFITGIAFRISRLDVKRLQLAGLIGAGLLVLSLMFPLAEPLRAVGLGSVMIFLATGQSRVFDAAKFGDLSYGLYIVHFPIIQTAIVAGLFASSPMLGLGVSLFMAFAAALVLWWLIERPALRTDSAYRVHGR